MDNNEKGYEAPQAEVIVFENEEVYALRGHGE